jgi:hypothetical protein
MTGDLQRRRANFYRVSAWYLEAAVDYYEAFHEGVGSQLECVGRLRYVRGYA